MTTIQQTPTTFDNSGFQPLRPYGQPSDHAAVAEDIVSLHLRLAAANERAARLEEQLVTVTAERDAAEHRAAELEDRNREMASDLDDALDIATEHALDADHERLAVVPNRYVNAFARAAHANANGWDR
ncbi:hypothetical protein JK358_34330 [Nocardia sp. 2]|uniref:Uncharacterized protein n=1 Tax=Nocardia acididurans TaxID=2802282 RepID=A0ABS1MG26_9NOCA|nr:hypothetical protein [Nocardia acididurans]MBL1079496.1 hypothetical protein [Nocardia acididurans]